MASLSNFFIGHMPFSTFSDFRTFLNILTALCWVYFCRTEKCRSKEIRAGAFSIRPNTMRKFLHSRSLCTCLNHSNFQFENSDSEEDEEVLNDLEPIYESRNVYHLRRLPHVVGTPKFMVTIVTGCGFNLRFRSRHYSNCL